MSSVAKSTPRNAIVEMLDYSSSNNDDVLEWWDGAHKSIASQNGTRNSSPRDATAEMQEDTLSDNDDNLECWDGVRKSQNCALLSGDHSFSLSPGSTKEKKGSVALKKDGPSFGNLDAAKEALDERRRVTFATAAASSSKRALEETASSSDADDDSSDCRVVERGRTSSSGSSFGQQGCTAGTTLDDAIRLLFSKDSDDDDEKHYGRTSNARKIEATTSPRKPALPNQIRGASTKNSLRVVPKVGRSARAMQHQNSIVSSSPTKPPSILSRDTTRNLLTSPEKKTRLLLFVDASFIEASPFIESSDPVSTSRSPQDHRAEPAPDQFPKDNDSDVQASCSQIDPCHGKNEMQEVPDEETQTAPQRECPDGSQASADVNFPDLGVLETLDKEWTKNASLSEGLEFEDRSEESPDIQQFIDMFSDDDDTKQDLLPVVELLSNELKDPDEFDLPAWMVCVDHLTKKTFRGTLPEWEFAVHGGDDGKFLYFFLF